MSNARLASQPQEIALVLRTDYLASPLYRFMHDHNAQFGDGDHDWKIEPLATVNCPIEIDLGGILETQAIEWFRRTYGPNLLLNCNLPACLGKRTKGKIMSCHKGKCTTCC